MFSTVASSVRIMTRATAVRGLSLVIAVVSIVTIGVEFVYTAFGLYADSEPLLSTRLVRWFSYFTNESNILVTAAMVMLVRDPERDGRWFRAVRLAGLIGITVTFVVYLVALRPNQALEGVHVWTNAGFHISVPILTVLGWLALGPWPRFDRGTLGRALGWVAAWILWTLVHGAVTGWYPYGIIDVSKLGYPAVLRTSALLVVFIVAVALLFVGLDRVRGRSARTA